jgi:predicted phage replisome organizer
LDVKWIKIVTDIFDDEKILLIESMPEADAMIVIWFKLLTLAGKINNGGVLLFNDKLPYTDEMLATIFRRPINTVRLAINTFEKFGMIEVINNAITIPNWSKHQSLDQLEQRNEYMKNYMREYREKQKLIANGECKLNSKANSKANVSEAEEDIEVDIDINNLPLKKESKKDSKIKKSFSQDDKEYKLANYLSKQIAKRLDKPLQKEETLQKWAAEFEKIVRIDGNDINEIRDVLAFSQKDDFWKTNILSAAKFRKQYLTLLAKMKQEGD